MEIKEIIVPENWECIIKNGIATFREKKQEPPRSWKEFCKRYPVKQGEAYIDPNSEIDVAKYKCNRSVSDSKNWCTSTEEAEAFLALMQLRQLRKAWIGDWKQTKENKVAGIFYSVYEDKITTSCGIFWSNVPLSFPSTDMAKDFLDCFKDLCETAKPLL